jgi:hypothetical protein
MNETTTFLGTTGTTVDYSGTYRGRGGFATPLNGSSATIFSNGSDYNSISTIITNQNNMVKQVKAAVFAVTRNEDNKVVSAKLLKEVWIEVKNGTSLDLAVAKELDKDFDPSTTVVKEIYSVTF